MSFFVIIKTGWALETQEFLTRLLERWPMAQIEEVRDPKISDSVEFELSMRSTLYGSLDRQGKGVTFHGGLEDSAEFVHWCRSLIPPDEDVIVCDESMGIDFVLASDMTPAEIIQAMRTSGS